MNSELVPDPDFVWLTKTDRMMYSYNEYNNDIYI